MKTDTQLLQLTKDSNSNPMMTLTVQGLPVEFLVDTGAIFSIITIKTASRFDKLTLSDQTRTTYGISGLAQIDKLSEPLTVINGNKTCTHPFLISETCPLNLLGRDLMSKLEMTIDVSCEGITVTQKMEILLKCYQICIITGL